MFDEQQVKAAVIHAGLRLSQKYLRDAPTPWGKEFLWQRVCCSYINWRDIELVAETRFGSRFHCNVSDMIQNRIIYFGVWEPNLTAFLQRRLSDGDGFIDVGANIGYYSILAAQKVGKTGCVLGIEASPSIFATYCENISLNRADVVRAVNVAVSDHDGTITIYRADGSNIGATTTLGERGFPVECQVPCAPLTRIATPDELRRARIIKIDVEGAELQVLTDIAENLHAFRDDLEIVTEVAPRESAAEAQAWRALLDRFAASGFHTYQLVNDYRGQAYVHQSAPTPPTRLSQLPARQCDVVLSRQFADAL